MNVATSLLDDIKTKQLQWYGNFQRMEKGDCQKKLWNGVHQEEENEVDLNLPGRKGLEDWWEKIDYPLGTVRPVYRTGISLLSRERFLYI